MAAQIVYWLLFRAVLSLSVTLTFFFLLHMRSRQISHSARSKSLNPVEAPNGLPVLGHAVSFSKDQAGYAMSLKKCFNGIPLRLRLMVMDIVYLTDPEHISSLFRRSTELTNGPYRKFVSSTFGVPKGFADFFAADNSGLSKTPLPGTNVKPEHRVDYLMHSFIVQFMTGRSLKYLAARFTENMEQRLGNLAVSKEFQSHGSLYDFVKESMFNSSVRAMFGTHLFEVDPDFCENFWRFEEFMPELAKGLPRWMYSKQYQARDKCILTVRQWQKSLARRRLEDPDAAEELSKQEYDDFFGSAIVKKRHNAFSKIEVMGADARASEDLALLWGANSNATHAAFWLIYSVLRNPATETRFLSEIRSAELACEDDCCFRGYDIDALCAIPFLQSLYAETLRMYVANIVLRSPRSTDIAVGDYRVRRGEILATMSYPMHQDETRFNTGTPENPHPLSDFWPERFLVSNRRPGEGQDPAAAKEAFSLKGTEGAWIPYGGGANMCPGRYFAKQEMLLTAALLIGNFEVQLVGEAAKIDWRYFGSGVLGVARSPGFLIRRRDSPSSA